jgi:hypothetical protein
MALIRGAMPGLLKSTLLAFILAAVVVRSETVAKPSAEKSGQAATPSTPATPSAEKSGQDYQVLLQTYLEKAKSCLKSFPWIIPVWNCCTKPCPESWLKSDCNCYLCLAGFVLFWFISGGRLVLRDWRVVVYCPEWFYKLVALVFSPTNWLITFIASRIPFRSQPDWALDSRLAPGKFSSLSVAKLEELKAKIRQRTRERFDERDVMQLFDSCPAASAEEMLCNWRGKVLHTGSMLDLVDNTIGHLDKLGLQWGKRYRSIYTGDPLMLNFLNRLVFPVPVWGNVSLPSILYRGKVNATMVYDHQPWQDYFRVLHDGRDGGKKMMLGIWSSHEKIGGWFTLEALPEIDVATRVVHLLQKKRSE